MVEGAFGGSSHAALASAAVPEEAAAVVQPVAAPVAATVPFVATNTVVRTTVVREVPATTSSVVPRLNALIDLVGNVVKLLPSLQSQSQTPASFPQQIGGNGTGLSAGFAVNQLANTTISAPSISGGSVSGASVAATALSSAGTANLAGANLAGDLSVGGNSTLAGNLTVGGILNAGTLTFTAASTTNLFTQAATSTTFYSSLANLASAAITTLNASVANVVGFTAVNGMTTSLVATNATTTNLVASNAITTTLFATGATTLATTTINGTLILNNGLTTGPLVFQSDAGQVSWIDLPVTPDSAPGAIESYSASIAETPMLTIFGLADGSGGTYSRTVLVATTTPGGSAMGGTGSDVLYVGGNTFLDGNQLTLGSSTQPPGTPLIFKLGRAATTTIPVGVAAFSIASAATSARPWLSINGSNGYVGVGTVSPFSQFEIYNSAPSALGPLLTLNNPAGGSGSGDGIDFRGSTDTQPINARIKTADTGSWSSDLIFLVKNPAYGGALVDRLHITEGGNIGIGTTSPFALLSVSNSPSTPLNTPFFAIASTTAGASSTNIFTVASTGNVTIIGSAATCTLGNGGSATNCSSSDARLKTNIASLDASSSLTAVLALNPVSFNWNAWMVQNGSPTSTQFGFIAQQVSPIFGNLVSLDPNTRYYKLDYQGLFAPMVGAIQALYVDITSIENTIAGFARSITTHKVNTDELCVQGTCVNGSQLAMLLATVQSSQASLSVNKSSATDTATTSSAATDTPPVIQINGSNPALVQFGTAYNDLGATITAPQEDANLPIQTYVNGVLTDQINIDTSQVATDTIEYVAIDQYGLSSTSTRLVTIQQ